MSNNGVWSFVIVIVVIVCSKCKVYELNIKKFRFRSCTGNTLNLPNRNFVSTVDIYQSVDNQNIIDVIKETLIVRSTG